MIVSFIMKSYFVKLMSKLIVSVDTLNIHKNVLTPKEVIKLGADKIIVGRPIFNSNLTVVDACQLILKEINNV